LRFYSKLPLNAAGWSNRGWLEIIEFILLMCENGARKTHVMYRCNLNSKQINQYLQFLLDSGMLEMIQERPNSKRYIYYRSRQKVHPALQAAGGALHKGSPALSRIAK
jgi:predicted transcriptional regulator